MIGNVLDTYTFTKPAGWQPAGVKAMRALAANQNVIYQPNTTLETSGTGGITPQALRTSGRVLWLML